MNLVSLFLKAFDDNRWLLILPGCWLLMMIGPAVWEIGPLFFQSFMGPDDYMRMVQVFDFLKAPFSSSFEQSRLGVVGSHDLMHWSRLPDIPLALIILIFEPFMGKVQAAYWAATIVPAVLTLILFWFGYNYTRLFVSDRRAILAVILLCLTWPMMRQFVPGRVDHHAYVLLSVLVGYGYIISIYFDPKSWRYPVYAGIALGLGLVIAVEALPWIGLAAALGAWFWLIKGEEYLIPNLLFGLSLLVTCIVSFLALRYPWAGFSPACDTLSSTLIVFVTAIPVFWCAMIGLARTNINSIGFRFMADAVVGMALVIGLYKIAPSCFFDPYEISDPMVRKIWLSEVNEAKGWFSFLAMQPQLAVSAMMPFVFGIPAVVWGMFRDPERRVIWSGLLLILICGLILMMFQIRFAEFASLLAVGPIVWGASELFFVIKGFLTARIKFTRGRRIALSFIFFLCCLGLFLNRFYHEKLSPEAHAVAAKECSTVSMAEALNGLPAGRVAAFIDYGPDILFRTDHSVLAAPYHRNEEGILAAYKILTSTSEAEAKGMIVKYRVDYVVACPAHRDYWGQFAKEDQDGKRHNFALRLLDDDVPNWLTAVAVPDGEPVKIYKVKN